MTSSDIAQLIQTRRFNFISETELQDGVELMLQAEQIKYEREVALTKNDKIDFLIENSIGLEVKVAGALASVTRQLYRYSQSPRVSSLVLVTNRIGSHGNLPDEMNSKPLHVVRLIESVL